MSAHNSQEHAGAGLSTSN